MTQEGWDTPRTDDDQAYEEAWERDRAFALEADEEKRERAQALIDVGTFVHSTDPRDDPEFYYVVLETDIPHVSGPCHKIAEPASEHSFYRQPRYLVDATAEVQRLVQQATDLIPKT